jgi:hypothetical protein
VAGGASGGRGARRWAERPAVLPAEECPWAGATEADTAEERPWGAAEHSAAAFVVEWEWAGAGAGAGADSAAAAWAALAGGTVGVAAAIAEFALARSSMPKMAPTCQDHRHLVLFAALDRVVVTT